MPEPIVDYQPLLRAAVTNLFFSGGLNLVVLQPRSVQQRRRRGSTGPCAGWSAFARA